MDVAFDRVPTTLPPQYLRNAMASCLACRVVYKEGERSFDFLGSAFAGTAGVGVAVDLS